MEQTWLAALQDLERTLPPQTFNTWILPLRPVHADSDSFVIEAPNKFFVDWLQDQDLARAISNSLRNQFGKDLQLVINVQKTQKEFIRTDNIARSDCKEQSSHEKARLVGINPKYTFDSFVVGPCNQFAYAASFAVADKSPGTYNPLFIYGGVGLGKTHLLNAIGNQKLQNSRDNRVCYVHSENFTNELIQAITNKKMPEFRDKYRRMDVLLIDDIQFIAGKERTEEEFFHTFNSLYETHKNIVVTSDRFPKEIPGIEDRLRSRFEWGLIADIQAPDMETKVAILQKKAQIEGIPLPYDVATFLATNFTSNIRELEGSLVRIAAFASLTHAEITIDLAREVLKDLLKDAGREITVDNVLKAVSEHYGVSVADLKGKRRTKAVAHPRQVAMYLCRNMTSCSFPEIGHRIGGRDHSTVIYAHSKVGESLKTDRSLQQEVASVRLLLSVR